MSTIYEQLAQVGIAGFRDAQLGIMTPGLVASGNQTEGWAHLAAFREALGVFKGEDKSQGGKGSYAADPL